MKYTFEEHFRYNVDKFPEGFLELLTQKLGLDTPVDKLKSAERIEELLREQIYFAKEILDEIEIVLKKARSLKEMRKQFIMIVENGYFER